MQNIRKSNTPIQKNGSKFPKWIVFVLGLIAFGIVKGGMKGCIREKAVNDAMQKYNNR